jgi:uncharacterized protein YqeY
MTLKGQIQNDVKDAMRAGDKDRLKVLRLISAAIKQVEVDTPVEDRAELDDVAVMRILEKMVKQRRDSIEQFTKGGRDDLAKIELAEIAVLESYLPEPLRDDELDALVEQAIDESAASSVRDMGKVMSRLRETTRGRADLSVVGARVKKRLGG